MQISRFLKIVLAVDALSCLGMGALLALAAAPLAALFGLPSGLVQGAGLALVPVGLFIGWVASRTRIPALFVWAVILGNVLWVIESLLLAGTANAITAIGTAFVIAQAAMVAALTLAETAGTLRAMRPAAA